MLALILAILKIIGIVLLVILCLIILIVAAVLFVPLRYRITGDYRGSPDKPQAETNVSWLFGFLGAGAFYRDGGFHYFVKILSFTLLSDEKKPEKSKKKRRRNSKSASRAEAFDDRNAIQADKKKREEEKAAAAGAAHREETSGEPERPGGADSGQKAGKKHFVALRKFCEKLRNLPEALRGFFSRIGEKKTEIGKKISSIKKILDDPAYMRLAGNLYGKIKRILSLLKPVRADVQIVYGADDPAATGQVTALVAAAAGIFGWQDVEFTPDFEKETLTAHVVLRGKLRLIHVLVIAVQVLTDKDFRRLVLHKDGSGKKHRRHRKHRKRQTVSRSESRNGQKG
jgi:hypothetical protein